MARGRWVSYGVAASVAIAIGVTSRPRPTAEDRMVDGRYASEWFRTLTRAPLYYDSVGRPLFGAEHRPEVRARVNAAYAALRAGGTNVLPFLVRAAVEERRTTALQAILEFVREGWEARSGSAPAFGLFSSQGVAERLISALPPRGRELLDLVEPYLGASAIPEERRRAIALLRFGKAPAPRTIEVLRELLQSGDRALQIPAAYALSWLGASASPAVPELLAVSRSGLPAMWPIIALGHAGTHAEAAVPDLEARFRAGRSDEALVAALALCLIRPRHAEAWPWLVRVVEGAAESDTGRRVRPSDFLRHVQDLRVANADVVELLRTSIRRHPKRHSNDNLLALELISGFDPVAADALVREWIANPEHPTDVTADAARLLRMQPTNGFAKELLVRAAGVHESAARFFAASGLLHAAELGAAEEALIRSVYTSPDLPADSRAEAAYQLDRLALRERLGTP